MTETGTETSFSTIRNMPFVSIVSLQYYSITASVSVFISPKEPKTSRNKPNKKKNSLKNKYFFCNNVLSLGFYFLFCLRNNLTRKDFFGLFRNRIRNTCSPPPPLPSPSSSPPFCPLLFLLVFLFFQLPPLTLPCCFIAPLFLYCFLFLSTLLYCTICSA
jgi:hypothetical protein